MSWFRRHSRKALIVICAICTSIVGTLHQFRFRSPEDSRLYVEEKFAPLQKGEFYVQDCIARFGTRAAQRADLVYLAIDGASIALDQNPAEIEASPALRLMKEGGWPWP